MGPILGVDVGRYNGWFACGVHRGNRRLACGRQMVGRITAPRRRDACITTLVKGDLPRMPAEFKKMGISFLYPDNWTLDEDDALAGRKSVTVYSPGGAFWSVSLHPTSTDPAHLAQAAIDVMRDEYPEVEADEARESLSGRELVGYDLSFYCLNLVSTAGIRCLRAGSRTLTVFYQAEDREFDRIEQVFRAMTTSLLGELEL